jgi:hypothetical protein
VVAGLLTIAITLTGAAPAPAPDKEAARSVEKGKTEPASAPVEATLIVKKDTYVLDRDGQSAAEYREAAKKNPPQVGVDLVLEIKNTSDKEIKIWAVDDYKLEQSQAGGDYVDLRLALEGPGAVSALVTQWSKRPKTPPPSVAAIGPGKSLRLPISSLSYGIQGVARFESHRAFWTEEGDYTLTATFKTAVAPAPEGSKDAKWAGFDGGLVTVTTPPVKLKVIGPEKAKQ